MTAHTPATQRHTAVMACTHNYTSHLQVGSQNIARQFVNLGWNVVYLSMPVSPLHLLALGKPGMKQRFRSAFSPWQHHHGGRLAETVPFCLLTPNAKPLLNSKPVIDNYLRTAIPPMASSIKRLAPKIDLLYIDNIFYHQLLQMLDYSRSVFRIMDLHDEFPGWKGRGARTAAYIASRADLVTYTAHGLETYARDIGGKNLFYMPNGVDCSLHENIAPWNPTGDDRPMALYVGNIDHRFDARLVEHLARKRPDMHFVLAGPTADGVHLETAPDNILCLGPVPHEKAAALMAHASVGLIPFDTAKAHDFLKGVQPLKLFEYMAAGLPVVSVRWSELESLDSPALLYDDDSSCLAALDTALREDKRLATLGREFARRKDWVKVCNQLLSRLDFTRHHDKDASKV